MHQSSSLLLFTENQLQIVALIFMAVVYSFKIRWILRFPAARDRQAPGSRVSINATNATSARRGAVVSLMQVATPWAMASTRSHPLLYAGFAVFHLGVAASIAMSFLIPYAPAAIAAPAAVGILQAVFAAACLAGIVRLYRRIADPHIRAISSPDDYFSLALLVVWLGLSLLAAPNRPERAEWPLTSYFLATAFFLVYVPFSKISHYIYYPFARWYLGRTLGYRGVYPLAGS